MNPDISVIIPAYNRPGPLELAVESVLAQTIPVSEIMIVDDGSGPEVGELVRHNVKQKPDWRERVRYFYQENQGQSVANNNGIAKASGEWLGFIAHDDIWLPKKLEWQFKALEQWGGECELCFTDGWFMNNPHMKMTLFQLAEKQYPGPFGIIPDPAILIAGKHPIWVQTIVARADLVRRMGRFDPGLRYGEDDEFLFRMALATKFCFVSMPMVLIDRSPDVERHLGVAREWARMEFWLRMNQARFEKKLRHGRNLGPGVEKTIRRDLRSIHSAWANWYLKQGEYAKARQAMSRAAQYELTPNIAMKWILTRIAPVFTKQLSERRDKRRTVQLHW